MPRTFVAWECHNAPRQMCRFAVTATTLLRVWAMAYVSSCPLRKCDISIAAVHPNARAMLVIRHNRLHLYCHFYSGTLGNTIWPFFDLSVSSVSHFTVGALYPHLNSQHPNISPSPLRIFSLSRYLTRLRYFAHRLIPNNTPTVRVL